MILQASSYVDREEWVQEIKKYQQDAQIDFDEYKRAEEVFEKSKLENQIMNVMNE